MKKVKVTIFTPVYNREKTLERLYNSLIKQTCKDFEWLVVNDGSTDRSELILNQFQVKKDNGFPIRYFYKKNGGKHRAINFALDRAVGDLFFIVDSDDWLALDAVEVILKFYEPIKNDSTFAGVAGTKIDNHGKISGRTFQGDYLDATSLERKKYNIIGEKSEVFKTEILRKHKFPEFESENFISEAVVWNKIAYEGYKLRWFNYPIYYWEYQENGLTSNLRNLYRNNPHGYLLYVRQEMIYLQEPLIKRIILLGKCVDTLRGTSFTEKIVSDFFNFKLYERIMYKICYPIYKCIYKRIRR